MKLGYSVLVERLNISVVPYPVSGDQQVLLRSEHGDLIERFDDGMVGLPPEALLVEPSPLAPREGEVKTVTIGRCSCGYADCGSVEVEIRCDGERVSWTNSARVIGVHFDRGQYSAELGRAIEAHLQVAPPCLP